MNTEIDYDLTPAQWDSLREMRMPGSACSISNRITLEELAALQLAVIVDNVPTLTPMGRKVLVKGSARLWDVAA
jgi:hypothetical protein